ncbi:MAG: G1 family endopeptidase [Thermoplasmata archaeon]|nr:G1 family endopeptidase [Thermoplasmata archaeon]
MRTLALGGLVAMLVLVATFLAPAVAAAPTAVAAGHGPLGSPTQAPTTVWAGYVALGSAGSVTKVSGTWTQPAVTCGSATRYALFFVGVDGTSLSDIEDIGTAAQCSGGTASYLAEWQFTYAGGPISSITIHPGDTISASIVYSSGNFTIKLTDGSHTFSKKVYQPGDARDSAECIVARPTTISGALHLANFGTVTFSSCKATISAVSGGIGSFASVFELTMTQTTSTKPLAVPSALQTGKKGFSVAWKRAN